MQLRLAKVRLFSVQFCFEFCFLFFLSLLFFSNLITPTAAAAATGTAAVAAAAGAVGGPTLPPCLLGRLHLGGNAAGAGRHIKAGVQLHLVIGGVARRLLHLIKLLLLLQLLLLLLMFEGNGNGGHRIGARIQLKGYAARNGASYGAAASGIGCQKSGGIVGRARHFCVGCGSVWG